MMAEFQQQPPSFEEYFNFDTFDTLPGPSSGPGTSSSRSSSGSPSHSHAALPLTPPNPFELAFDPASTYFNLLDDEFAKLEPQALAPISAAPPSFLSTFAPVEESSPASSGDSPSTIDPQLVETPATSARSEFGDEEEEGEDDDSMSFFDGEGDMMMSIKVGGKGKSRKGTVQSGGVVKKTNGGKDKKDAKANMLSTTTTDPDDWRPTPEEYKKMSSKEKRQLRNKISARNFRVRRKEYISTLEGDIAERDRLLDAVRTELRNTSDENKALRQEIDALKKALLDGRGEIPVLPPPAPLPAISAAAALASSGLKSPPPTPAPKSPLPTPNVRKDLPMSPRLASRGGFWGGNFGLGGATPVHTTLVPDLSSVLSGKGAITSKRSPTLQENINPTLNAQMQPEKTMELSMPMTPFDSFSEMNPFTMKTLDAYRMHLWTRMAQMQAHQHHNKDSQAQAPGSPQPQLTGLASNLRPHYFTKSSVLSSVLAGKSAGAASAYPTPPSSPPTSFASLPSQAGSSKHPNPTAQQAMLASMASQTLLGKLGSAFWEAFSGGSPASGSPASKLDTDKVRRVLEGKAVLRVVDVDTPAVPTQVPMAPAASVVAPRSPSLPSMDRTAKCEKGVCLEKMFGKLHI